MKRVRIRRKVQPPRERREDEALPLDPRLADGCLEVCRAKSIGRRSPPTARAA